MKGKNICKFITEPEQDRLRTVNFVFERNREAMSNRGLPFNTALIVICGEGKMRYGSELFTFRVGTLIFGFAGEAFEVISEGDVEYIYVSFDGGRGDELFRRFGISPVNRAFDGFEALIPFWQSCLSGADDQSVDLVSESALLYAFSRLSGRAAVSDDAVDRAISLVDEEFSDPEFSLNSAAKQLGYNSKYLSHAFKKKMGLGFSQYLTTVRIRNAVLLMEHGVDSVKNISFLCGFSDPLYFSTVFKKTVGMTPTEKYRRMKKG
ncbi:MAG: helix-turn-helix transcriptional regulator [Clostridia bacterium]|nr:helix-turn-helix transcriptional regulator [Clostridia bacterium]